MGWKGRSGTQVTAALWRGVCVFCTVFMGACGDGAAEVIGTETAWFANRSLLIPTAKYSVLGETEASAVQVGEFSCDAKRQRNGGPRPGLMMPAPGEVQFDLPEGLVPGVRLFVEMGISRKTNKRRGRGEVVFEVLLGDELALSKKLSFGRDTPETDRLWSPAEISLGTAETLTLRTRLFGDNARNVEVIFASLELREPLDVPRTKASADHPNIIFLVIDTLRSDRLEPYGYDRPTSPNIKEVADGGVVFERTLAPSPWTPPSTASLLSGMDPLRHGLVDSKTAFLAYEDTTIAEVCRAAGMRTVALIANPILSPGHNYWQGFQEYHEKYSEPGINLIEDAREWIEEQDGSRFFLYLHLFDPHKPYFPMEPYIEQLSQSPPPGYRPGIVVEMMKSLYEGGEVDGEVLEQYIAHESDKYDAEIAGCDAAIGDLFAALDELSIRDRTLVAITSDHGEAFGEHGRLGHSNYLYDEMLRIPLIFTGPGVPAGERRTERVELKDTGKTLLELANVPGAHRMEGRNLLAKDSSRAGKELLFSSTWVGLLPLPEEEQIEEVGRIFRVESTEWTLIWVPREEGEEDDHVELYEAEVAADAAEDMAAKHPEVVEKLRDAIVSWIDATHRDRGTWSSGEGTLELLRALGYVGDD